MGISPENYFQLKDGTTIRNLFELSKALEKMPEDMFQHHVNKERNDFYNWVNDVVKDKDLASRILAAGTRKQMQKEIGKKMEKDVVKEMAKKRTATVRTKSVRTKPKAAKPTAIKSKQLQVLKNKALALKNKVYNLFLREEEKPKKKLSQIDPESIKWGIGCPYKTIHCGILEFVFGVVMGLLIALVLTAIL
ncbi:hypothetical protein KY332_00855 [Candidatus Woesearchaeota archaeon]|nr:hypothetical protein [Candidatus Woesearchaeota archaeon]